MANTKPQQMNKEESERLRGNQSKISQQQDDITWRMRIHRSPVAIAINMKH